MNLGINVVTIIVLILFTVSFFIIFVLDSKTRPDSDDIKVENLSPITKEKDIDINYYIKNKILKNIERISVVNGYTVPLTKYEQDIILYFPNKWKTSHKWLIKDEHSGLYYIPENYVKIKKNTSFKMYPEYVNREHSATDVARNDSCSATSVARRLAAPVDSATDVARRTSLDSAYYIYILEQ